MFSNKEFMYHLHDQLGGNDKASTELFMELVAFLPEHVLHSFDEHYRQNHEVTIPEIDEPDSATDIIDVVEMRKNLAQCSEV